MCQYGSLYFGAVSAKKIMFSTYYLVVFGVLCGVWLLPEYRVFDVLLFKLGGVVMLSFFIFRALREDTLGLKKFGIDPFKVFGDPLSFISRKHSSVLFRFRDRVHSPIVELFCVVFLIFDIDFMYNSGDYSFGKILDSFGAENIPISVVYLIILFFLLRQPSYAFLG